MNLLGYLPVNVDLKIFNNEKWCLYWPLEESIYQIQMLDLVMVMVIVMFGNIKEKNPNNSFGISRNIRR